MSIVALWDRAVDAWAWVAVVWPRDMMMLRAWRAGMREVEERSSGAMVIIFMVGEVRCCFP